jgi:hypothetical protein
MSSNAEIVKHHVESLVNGDVDEVMSDFAANAVILCGPQPIRGSEAIRAFFSGIPASFDGFELDASASESDHHYIAWHTAGGLAAPTRSASATARLSCRQPFYSISSTDLSAAHDVPSPPHFNQHEHLHMASENRALRGIRCVTDAARLDADANVASRRIEQRLSVNSSTPGPTACTARQVDWACAGSASAVGLTSQSSGLHKRPIGRSLVATDQSGCVIAREHQRRNHLAPRRPEELRSGRQPAPMRQPRRE